MRSTASPGLIRAFLAAQDQANGCIAADRGSALKAYVTSSQMKVPQDQLQEMLADPANSYSLAQTGTLKTKPAAWTDLFLREFHDNKGS